RFAARQWHDKPVYALIQQSYLMVSEQMLRIADSVDGLEPRQKEKMRFALKGLLDASSPANFAMTNPLVLEKMVESKGENLLKGLDHMLSDMRKGQLTHTDPDAFELSRNIAVTPG
ncbi:MAG: class I poly(R)-hydroxyalkanoic acid synthase, partial [Blastomonas fulva]